MRWEPLARSWQPGRRGTRSGGSGFLGKRGLGGSCLESGQTLHVVADGDPCGVAMSLAGASSLGGHSADRSRGWTLQVLPLLSQPEVTRLTRAFV